jgi:hypothetical protein
MVVMDAMNRRQSLTWTRTLGAALGLALSLGVAACGAPNAADDDESTGTDDTADGIGTSPSEPTPPAPQPPPAAPAKRRATPNDPTGCPAGTNVVLGTSGDDVLESLAPDTCFVGLGGADTIYARAARDIVIVGDGAALVAGFPDVVVRGNAELVRLVDDASR